MLIIKMQRKIFILYYLWIRAFGTNRLCNAGLIEHEIL